MSFTTRIPPSACPRCGRNLDAAINPFEHCAPSVGDLTVCIQCASVLEFDEHMQLKIANLRALDLSMDVLLQLARTVAAVRQGRKEFKHQVN